MASDNQCFEEEQAVQQLGREIGYGRIMQLCEKLWGDDAVARMGGREEYRGEALSQGPCVAFLVPCKCRVESTFPCMWCCGSGRVTKRVREAQG
jgi:hypothetical protein